MADETQMQRYNRWLEEIVRPRIAEACSALGNGDLFPEDFQEHTEYEVGYATSPGSPMVRDILRIAGQELSKK